MGDAATLKQAEAARAKFSDDLAQRGAHAIGVEEAKDGWSVVAFVEPGRSFDAPATLSVKLLGRSVAVPLVVQREDMAKPE
ncbi:MAG: hypothetical protein WC807_20380 [Hyphomicrobium sp.]|jgi:hypothetical protein